MTITIDWKNFLGFIFLLGAGVVFALAMTSHPRSLAGASPADAATPLSVQCAPANTPAAAPLAPVVAPPPPPSIGSGNDILAVHGSSNTTQGTDGGFGDIGMQFQGVTLNAPITNVHISNEGSGNTTGIAIGGTVSLTSDPGTSSAASNRMVPVGPPVAPPAPAESVKGATAPSPPPAPAPAQSAAAPAGASTSTSGTGASTSGSTTSGSGTSGSTSSGSGTSGSTSTSGASGAGSTSGTTGTTGGTSGTSSGSSGAGSSGSSSTGTSSTGG